MKHAQRAVTVLIVLFIISCNKKTSTPGPSDSVTPPSAPSRDHKIDAAESSDIYILNDLGQKVPFARVLIGDHVTTNNQWLTADENGFISLSKTWTEAQTLTIEAADHIRLSLKDQVPGARTLVIRKKPRTPNLTLRGNVSGVSTKDKDGYIDFAIVLDSMTKKDVLNFNVNKVVSPWTEKISALGFDFPVPQNIFLPKQKESYLLTVTLQKTWFDMPYDSYGKKSLYSLQGRFPFKKIISEVQNKTAYFELVNYFEFSGAGKLEHNFSNTSAAPTLNAAQIKMDASFTMQTPSIPSDQVIFGLSTYKDNDLFQPLDVKYMQSREKLIFKTNKNVAPYFIGVLKNKNEFTNDSASMERASISINSPKDAIRYLPLIQDPSWNSTSELHINLPTISSSAFSEQGMVVIISELHPITLPDGKVLKYKIPLWEIHSPTWASRLTIPDFETSSATARRVEVTLLARATDNSGQQNTTAVISNHEERIESATHLTKSASDY